MDSAISSRIVGKMLREAKQSVVLLLVFSWFPKNQRNALPSTLLKFEIDQPSGLRENSEKLITQFARHRCKN